MKMTNKTIITCTRRIQFCAGHRVMGHENKCAHLHGHNYVVLVTATAEPNQEALDNVGRVVDFSVLKDRIGSWIERQWDHGFILNIEDTEAIEVMRAFYPRGPLSLPQKLYCMPSNPTAENMADHLLNRVCPDQMRGTGVMVTQVRVWETENCYADAIMPGM